MDKVLRINELTLDGILRQIDGMQPLDYNISKKHVNLGFTNPLRSIRKSSFVRNNNICR